MANYHHGGKHGGVHSDILSPTKPQLLTVPFPLRAIFFQTTTCPIEFLSNITFSTGEYFLLLVRKGSTTFSSGVPLGACKRGACATVSLGYQTQAIRLSSKCLYL